MTNVTGVLTVTFALLLALFIPLPQATKIVQPYRQGTVTVFGSYRGLINPGFNLLNPFARSLR